MILGIPFSDIVFYVVAAFMIVASICTIVSKNVLQSAIFLIATFIGTAIVYVLLQAEFMAVAQIMVYAGGVVVFMIFAILLTSHLGEESFTVHVPRKFIAGAISIAFVAIAAKFLLSQPALATRIATAPAEASSFGAYAIRLLSPGPDGFLIPFELISILLLMALVASVTIAKKDSDDSKEEK